MAGTWIRGRCRSGREILQHHLNGLHVLGRLIAIGIPLPLAYVLARRWELLAHPWLYGA